ncbi:hypothetical protein [Haloarchaeobius sp. DYHT-AS-18]|uniref:hypothetical protein n=1 Tax=Haloarchaeobius sp. DYHT-AS-18 TaxID=3446117 RepID=UPI003EB6EA44
MDVFDVPRVQVEDLSEDIVRTNFNDGTEFNEYLSNYFKDIASRDLYIVSGVTDIEGQSNFSSAIQEQGWDVEEDYGAVLKIGQDYGDHRAQAYLYYNPDNQLFFLYTDQRKTEEIDNSIIPLLEDLESAHYLYISPRTLRQVVDMIAEEEEAAEVTEFVAKRNEGTKIDSEERPDVERTINYYADDGLKTLREVGEKYGVLPHILEISIPDKITFRVNKEGVFKLVSGSLDFLFQYIEECIEQTLSIKDAYDSTAIEPVEITQGYTVSQSIPARIELTQPMTHDELKPLKSNLKEEDYALIDSHSQRGSVYFTSKIYDSENNIFFNVRADEEAIRVFPRDEKNISTFFRFFEVIQSTLDDRAEPATVDIQAS